MKNFWLFVLIAGFAGASVAWSINHRRYGHRVSHFGPFAMDGKVTPAKAVELVDSQAPSEHGVVELVNGSEHDFGVMAPGTSGEHVFVIKNAGDGDLKLRVGASSCKCTIGSLDNETIAPGETTEVKLEWKISSAEQKTDFAQNAQLLTTDPGNYGITLHVLGRVVGDVALSPPNWSFGEVAAGEPFDFSGTIYSFYEEEMIPKELRFSDDYLNDFATIEVEPFEPSEEDGIYATAKQGFRINVKVKAGLRQGAVSQNFQFGFQRMDANGDLVAISKEGEEEEFDAFVVAPVTGRIVGALGMIAGARVEGVEGGGYIYNFGRIRKDDELIGKSFVVLKGTERNNTKLRIGEVTPESMIKARLGEPLGRGSMTLYPLEIELIPGESRHARMGKNRDDYGNIWIESDNPKVTKMRIAVKFAVDPR